MSRHRLLALVAPLGLAVWIAEMTLGMSVISALAASGTAETPAPAVATVVPPTAPTTTGVPDPGISPLASPPPPPPSPAATSPRPRPPATHPATKKPTRAPAPKPKPAPTHPTGNVRPGAFCEPPGAHGMYNGHLYTCKGPGQPRWRR